ncbi:PREDICTED: glutamate receptor ionotropic, kainate 2-like [Branchiostoma belcheri]|uniref:Glutamate receptor ionotropic, kainate 2-like n=1 Tax=Branchiostoma belcheri TaxID=7741 RepID=A0A6P5A6X6_BRABE|nr:PREDICTED: glutamate receptor ionotropic, kainate 2-like [Branchiostoma belcheri]
MGPITRENPPPSRTLGLLLGLLLIQVESVFTLNVNIGVMYAAGNKEAYGQAVRDLMRNASLSPEFPNVTFSFVELERSCTEKDALDNAAVYFKQRGICNLLVVNNDRKVVSQDHSLEGEAVHCAYHDLRQNNSELLTIIVQRPQETHGLPPNSGMWVTSYPEPADLSLMIVNTVEKYKWTSAFVLYDKFADAYKSLEKFLNWAADRDWLLRVKEIPLIGEGPDKVDRPALTTLLRQIKSSRESHIILLSNSAIINDVLDRAVYLLMVNYQYHWIITSLNAPLGDLGFDDFHDTGVRVTFFHPNTELGGTTRIFERLVLDGALTLAHSAVEAARAVNRGEMTAGEAQCRLRDYITQIEFDGYTGNVHYTNQHGRVKVRNNLVMDLMENTGSHLVKVGRWSQVSGANLTSQFNSSFFTNPVLGGKILRIISKERDPWVRQKPHADTEGLIGVARYEGFLIDMLNVMSKRLNFTFQIDVRDNITIGSQNETDGSWDGMIGMLHRREYDLALDAVATRSFRLKAVDFTEPIEMAGYYLIMKRPSKAAPGLLQFLNPFSYTVWAVMLCANLGVAILLAINNCLNPYEWGGLAKRGEVEEEEGKSLNFFNSLWTVWGAYVAAGPEFLPRSFAGRVLASMWFFVCLVAISSYTANLAAFLTKTNLDQQISSLKDLANSDYRFGALERNTIVQFLMNSTEEPYKTLGRRLKRWKGEVLLDSREKLLKKAEEERFVFIADNENQFRVKEQLCKLIVVGERFFRSPTSLMFPRGSPYVTEFNRQILLFREEGYMDILRDRYLNVPGECATKFIAQDDGQLQIESFIGLFYLLLVGVALFLIVGLVEIFVYRVKPEKKEGETKDDTPEPKLEINGQLNATYL